MSSGVFFGCILSLLKQHIFLILMQPSWDEYLLLYSPKSSIRGTHIFYIGVRSQSRQSAKLFSSRRIWDSPSPRPQAIVPPPPFGSGGRGAHWLARVGVGESQFRRGDIHCGTLYICTLCLACTYIILLKLQQTGRSTYISCSFAPAKCDSSAVNLSQEKAYLHHT